MALRIFFLLPFRHISTLPSGSPFDSNTLPVDFTTFSPGFQTFSTLPEQALDTSPDWISSTPYGIWDNVEHALNPIHPHDAGLPYPTERSLQCAHIKDMVREGMMGKEALLPFLHESLHESVAPSISAPNVNNRWYEKQYEEQFHDAEEEQEVDQPINQHNHDELDDLPEGNVYRGGTTEARSSFRHEHESGGMLDVIPMQYLQGQDSGRRSSVHFESYSMYDPTCTEYTQGIESFERSGEGQAICTQDLLASFGQTRLGDAPLPPLPSSDNSRAAAISRGRRIKIAEQRAQFERDTMECLNDVSIMNAWQVYKNMMNASASQPGPNDAIWKRFLTYKDATIIGKLNSGHLDEMINAKERLAQPNYERTNSDDAYLAPRHTWSSYAKKYYDKDEFQRLTLKCCQVCQIAIQDQSARKYWMNKLLTRSNEEIVDALKRSQEGENDKWAIGQLAGKAFLDAQLKRERAAASNAASRSSGSRRS